MSVQFGRINLDGQPLHHKHLEEVRPLLAPYGRDGDGSYCKQNFGVLYRAFHTTKESCREAQPHVLESGSVLTWDGRLDNCEELARQLGLESPTNSPDVVMVAAAFEKWNTGAFSKLIGDWALSIWDVGNRCLILAKDFVGTRHLYYTIEKEQVTWCTILDPLILLGGRRFKLDEEYIAGWLSFFPAPHLTPYVGICSVPPSSFVQFTQGNTKIAQYWDFDPSKRILYRTDSEYEEHFRTVFAQSVRRRLRCDSPVLAELSGGMDSSSIVCMADAIGKETDETPRLDTVSYFDDSEPNWNERPYFSKVEEKRGRIGCHIDVHTQSSLFEESTRFAATPASSEVASDALRQFASCMATGGNKVLLSGVGGDEAMGGVPSPTPELADLLARAQIRALVRQLKLWALEKRKPWFYLFFETATGFLPSALVPVPKYLRPAPWLKRDFVQRNRNPLAGYSVRTKLRGPLPSFQDNLNALDGLRRQLESDFISSEHCFEKRYPYLDRDLLEFVYAIPRQQLVRPGQRRSLMRRSLTGIVPDELLNRRRKAFVARAQIVAVGEDWPELIKKITRLVSDSMGIVLRESFVDTLTRARNGQEVQMVPLLRTLALEFWLRSIEAQRLPVQNLPEIRSFQERDRNFDRTVSAS
jgi:asparagine synthase (glutamine-hydrolysing)